MNGPEQLLNQDLLEMQLAEGGLSPSSLPRFLALAGRATQAGFTAADEICVASAAGRTELSGNHTDHNLGCVLAASINLDSIALVRPRKDPTVRVLSEGYGAVEIQSDQLAPQQAEQGTTAALIRGVLAGFADRGLRVGGFDAVAGSTVLAGSGLSSSASFEVLVGVILSHLYNEADVGSTVLAQIGQFAENRYFGKPSGLMDQVACATGGAVWIDFADRSNPKIERVPVSFEELGYTLCVVDTGGDHADLTRHYAAIIEEMGAIAGAFGKDSLSEVDQEAVLERVGELRRAHGDRAINRALHFFGENRRVGRQLAALRARDIRTYITLMHASGTSSARFLQNSAPPESPRKQAVVTAIALSEHCFAELGVTPGVDAAARVQGGGFAGTIQVLLPRPRVDEYRERMNGWLEKSAVTRLAIRDVGATAFTLKKE